MSSNQIYLHEYLIEACKNGNLEDVKQCLDHGADPNFNIRNPSNALHLAIQSDNHQIITLLLEHGAILKEFVLQKAIERDKSYLDILLPDFCACEDTSLLMGVLQAAIHMSDENLAKQAIAQGAKPASLFLYAIRNINSTKILKLLIENGFNIHAENNMLISEWMESSPLHGGESWKSAKDEILAFIFEYYLEKPDSIEKFKSLRVPDKKHLFLTGLYGNNFNMMKFALLIGAEKNEALNTAHRQYNAYNEGKVSSIYSKMYEKNKSGEIGYEIIEYILNSDMDFKKTTISRAVCFEYSDILNALHKTHDLEYAYEMAYKYENENLCKDFVERGVCKEAQNLTKIKVSAIKGNIKELHQAMSDASNVKRLEDETMAEIIYENQVESLKYLYDIGMVFHLSLNNYLDKAMSHYKAYESISYLIEQGFDIGYVKNIPREYRKKYPAIANMHERRFSDIFEYTIYLAREVYPSLEGKEKENILQRVAELSSLPYVMKKSKGQTS